MKKQNISYKLNLKFRVITRFKLQPCKPIRLRLMVIHHFTNEWQASLRFVSQQHQ